jgi:hypothetical protein
VDWDFILNPKTLSIESLVIGPSLRMLGNEDVRSSTVDSIPMLHCPPSINGGQFLPNAETALRHLVVLNILDVFALGAAIGNLTFLRIFRKTGCDGERRATEFKPAVISVGIHFFLGRIRVKGPGQK